MAADLHDLSSFENVPFSVDPSRFEMGKDFLTRLQSYDPTAHFQLSGDVNAGEGGPQEMWNLVFDASKLPPRPGGSNFSSLENIVQFGKTGGGESGGGDVLSAVERPGRDLAKDMYKEGLQAVDPVYGRYTDTRNWKPEERDWKSWAWTAAPLVIGGIATLGAGLPAVAGMVGAEAVGAGAGAAATEGLFGGVTASQASTAFRTGTGIARGLLGGDESGSKAPMAPALQAILQAASGKGSGSGGSSAGIPPALLLLLALASQGRGGNEEG